MSSLLDSKFNDFVPLYLYSLFTGVLKADLRIGFLCGAPAVFPPVFFGDYELSRLPCLVPTT